MAIQHSSLPPDEKNKFRAKKETCKACIRTRWLMTFLILASMSTVLYLNEFSG